MILSEKITLLRKRKGLSQEEFADKFNITRQAVQKWESGQSTPDVYNLKIMADLFGVSMDTLIDDSLELTADKNDLVSDQVSIKKSYGVVKVSKLSFKEVYEETRNEYVTPSEKIKDLATIRLIIRIIAFIIGAVLVVVGFLIGKGLGFIICLLLGLIIMIFALLFNHKTKKMLLDSGWFYDKVYETEKELEEKGYWYLKLEYDRLFWFFYDPKEKTFGFYFKDKERFFCPIQNYVDFTVQSSGGGIKEGDNSLKVGAIVGVIAGVGVESETTYVSQDDRFYDFTLSFANRMGELKTLEYTLDTYRGWHYHNSTKKEVIIKMENNIAYSIKEACAKIKTKLDFEKSQIN